MASSLPAGPQRQPCLVKLTFLLLLPALLHG